MSLILCYFIEEKIILVMMKITTISITSRGNGDFLHVSYGGYCVSDYDTDCFV